VNVVALSLVAVVLTSVTLQPPTPSPRDIGEQNQREGARTVAHAADPSESRGDRIIANVPPSPQTEASSKGNGTKRKDAASKYERRNFVVNVLLLIVFVLQLVAFGVQAYYMRGALNAAEDGVIEARNALEASERHASAERESAERSAVAANEATARALVISDRNAQAAEANAQAAQTAARSAADSVRLADIGVRAQLLANDAQLDASRIALAALSQSANQAQTSAEIALNNLVTMRTSARAWLLVQPAPLFGRWNDAETFVQGGESGIKPTLTYSVLNGGQCPAWIVRQRFGVSVVTEPPGEPDYTDCADAPPRPVAPGARQEYSVERFIDARARLAVERAQSVIMVYGLIEYRDALQTKGDPMRESAFCWIYRNPIIQLASDTGIPGEAIYWRIESGPESYISNT